MERIKDLNEKWDKYVENKNAYSSGNEEILLNDFAELVKNTFEVITNVKMNYIEKQVMPENTWNVHSYLELISLLSEYAPNYDIFEDKSRDLVFSVTYMIVDSLKFYATYPDVTISGLLWIYPEYYSLREDAHIDKDEFIYDIYDADFSELFEFAKALL